MTWRHLKAWVQRNQPNEGQAIQAEDTICVKVQIHLTIRNSSERLKHRVPLEEGKEMRLGSWARPRSSDLYYVR